MLYEAGALSKSVERSRVVPYLFGFSPRDLQGPLVQFQAAVADRDDTFKLVHAINRALNEGRLPDSLLNDMFDILWPRLEERLRELFSLPTPTQLPPKQKSSPSSLDALVKDLLQPRTEPTSSEEPVPSNYVFIVHGHNDAAKEKVARLVEKLGLHAVILHEQPSRGQTIIEKFESYTSVGYAIVLLTADDRGGHANASVDEQRPRARQNVVFELGYFIARLGRNRVGVLFQDAVEIPSDYSGVNLHPARYRRRLEVRTRSGIEGGRA